MGLQPSAVLHFGRRDLRLQSVNQHQSRKQRRRRRQLCILCAVSGVWRDQHLKHPAVAGVERVGGATEASGNKIAVCLGGLHLVTQHVQRQRGRSVQHQALPRQYRWTELPAVDVHHAHVHLAVVPAQPWSRKHTSGRLAHLRHLDLPRWIVDYAGPEQIVPGLSGKAGHRAGNNDDQRTEDMEDRLNSTVV